MTAVILLGIKYYFSFHRYFNRYSYFSGSINEEMVKNGQVAFKTFIENRDENSVKAKQLDPKKFIKSEKK